MTIHQFMMEKLFCIVYNPNVPIADAAGAITNGFYNVVKPELFLRIMCWVHMFRNVDKHLNGTDLKNFKDEIITDIKVIQKSKSKENFDYLASLFASKWKLKKNLAINAFLEYFHKEWIASTNCGWYEGICDPTPKQNNALEATNLVIKTHHTLRSRLSMNHYLNNATHMMKQWSIDRTKDDYMFQHKELYRILLNFVPV